jgi:hypothetical protein
MDLAQLCARNAGFEFDLLSMYYLRSHKAAEERSCPRPALN